MPFLNGQASFSRLSITSPNTEPPGLVGTEHLDALREQVLVPSEIGVKGEIETGWCAGDHVFDEAFTPEHTCYEGGCVAHLAMRTDTNRVPAELKRAIRAQLETRLLEDSGQDFLSRADKRDLRDLLEQSLHKERASNKHRSSTMTPMLWDAERSTILLASSSNKATESIVELMRRTFGGALLLTPQSAGCLAYEYLAQTGRTRDLEDMRPSPFTAPPPHAPEHEGAIPVVPWAAGSTEPHDFLGNEMLLWLWHVWDQQGGSLDVTLPNGATSHLQWALDRSIELHCAWGATGKLTLRADEDGPSPARLPEAADALATGKWPRKLGLLLVDDEGSSWRCTLQGDRWAVTGIALPDPPDEIETEHERRSWRIDRVRALDERLLALFGTFLEARAGERWSSIRESITSWIRERRPQARPTQEIEAMPAPTLRSA